MENFEMDEWGGEKAKPGFMNGFGCVSPGCKATFTRADRRKAHIEMLHPHENSGPSSDMVQMARIRPELAEAMGMTQEEVHAPQNVRELEWQQNRQARIEEVSRKQDENENELKIHPVYRPLVAALSHISTLRARALATEPEYRHDNVREVSDLAHVHLTQFAHGVSHGASVDDPMHHLEEGMSHMHHLNRMTQSGMTHKDDSESQAIHQHEVNLYEKGWGEKYPYGDY
jgi:hypothetical protein